ncbi:hypothetical protein [Streptomyces pseudovenezuelae]|uniref:DNA-binding CsgD family transcriptional regulator n=1 Tax=Streptomyces pseudovenezuelae TaxID=67350 RepID=A0ABT6LLB3_9ACTN|nr:hypothetical protein [Streptomyces pseudovenezuelae]MDH6217096.1 DNA-binding CsgD family transcriptional regulator [Streptomyces pseudovenezuelae]
MKKAGPHHADRPLPAVGDKGPNWNTKARLRVLRDLLAALPDPSAPAPKRERRPAPGKAKRLKDAQVKELVGAYRTGVSTYQLAERFGIKRQTVSAILKRNGVTPRWRRLREEDVDQAERLYTHQRMSVARIADRMKVDPETVRLRLRKRGVKMRDPHDRS